LPEQQTSERMKETQNISGT